MYFQCSGYHEKNLRPRSLKARVNHIVRNLDKLKKQVKFDAIAFRGMSGAAVAYPVSVLGGYHLISVRKGRRHHGAKVEGSESRDIKRYIILDDFINTGKTVRAIAYAVKKEKGFTDTSPECVGIALYEGGCTEKRSEFLVDRKKIPVFDV